MRNPDRREALKLMIAYSVALSAARPNSAIAQDGKLNDFFGAIADEHDQGAKDLRKAFDRTPLAILKKYDLTEQQIERIVRFRSVDDLRQLIDRSTQSGEDLYNETDKWGSFLQNEFKADVSELKLKLYDQNVNWATECKDSLVRIESGHYPHPQAAIYAIVDGKSKDKKISAKSSESPLSLTLLGQGFVAGTAETTVEFVGTPAVTATVQRVSGSYRCGAIEMSVELPSLPTGQQQRYPVRVVQQVGAHSKTAEVQISFNSNDFTVIGDA